MLFILFIFTSILFFTGYQIGFESGLCGTYQDIVLQATSIIAPDTLFVDLKSLSPENCENIHPHIKTVNRNV